MLDTMSTQCTYNPVETVTHDSMLMIQTLSGDPAWKPTLDFALRHIARRGGVGSLLSEPSLGPDRRFLVEQIAVADLFSEFCPCR
jgi:hypothetical protein